MKKNLLSLVVMLMSLSASAQWIEGPVTKDPSASETTLVTPKPDRQYKYFRLNKPDHSVVREGQASVKHRIDSTIAGVVGSPGYSITYDYTGVGNPSSETTYYPGSNTYFRRDYVYDSNGLTLEWISLSYDSITSSWTNGAKREYVYTVTGKTDYWISYLWDAPTSQWRNYLKWDYTYDANDNVILLDEYTWNSNTNQWVINNSTATTFSPQNYQTMEIYSVSNGAGGLTPFSKIEIFYGQVPPVFPDSLYLYYYDVPTQSWQLQYRTTYVLLNATTGDYSSITEYQQGAGNWVPSNKDEVYWDNVGNLVETISMNPSGTSWVNYNRFTWTYNNANLLPDLYVSIFYQYLSMAINQKYYLWTNNQWSLGDSTDYYWSGVTTGLESPGNSPIKVFPNPAQHELTIAGDQSNPSLVRITDITGKVVHEESFSALLQLNISDWNNGVYFWTIIQQTQTTSGKFIKD